MLVVRCHQFAAITPEIEQDSGSLFGLAMHVSEQEDRLFQRNKPEDV